MAHLEEPIRSPMSKKKKGFQKLLYSYAKQIIGIDQDSENT